MFKKLGEEGMDVPYMFHAELAGPIDKATASLEQSNAHPAHYSTFLHSRPKVVSFVCYSSSFFYIYLIYLVVILSHKIIHLLISCALINHYIYQFSIYSH